MNNVLLMSEQNLQGKRVLIREDLNVPIRQENGVNVVSSAARIDASLPTIKKALASGAAVMLMSHLGRPTEGAPEEKYSLKPVADYLSAALGQAVPLIDNWLDGVDVAVGQVVLLENVRFNQGEKSDDAGLSKKMSELCDIYVMDAFGTAHRAQASTHGVAKAMKAQDKTVCAGPLLAAELSALSQALDKPAQPMVAIVGGSKVSTKLDVLHSLSDLCSQIIVGGGIANTFLAAAGKPVGQSLYEPDLLETAKHLMQKVDIPLPIDVVVAKQFVETAEATIKLVDDVAEDDMILDVGPQTAALFDKCLASAQTIIWNGPLGVFEFSQFAQGTASLAESIAKSSAFSIAGGGDTLAAIAQFEITDKVSYISTGGGAFLEFVEGKILPAVAVLQGEI